MPAPHPKEFREDVVARKGEASIAQLARDFGISESCLRNWMRQADVEDGVLPGVTVADGAELKEARPEAGSWSKGTRFYVAPRRTCLWRT